MRRSLIEGAHPTAAVYEHIGDSRVLWRVESLDKEYHALHGTAGVVDLSGLGFIRITGHDAPMFLEQHFTRDISYMTPEKSVTGLLLNEDGVPLDLVVVYKDEGGYLVETSVGRGSPTIERLRDYIVAEALAVELTDLTASVAIIGVEGPEAWQCGNSVLGIELGGLLYEGVMQAVWSDTDLTISRTGFTSEYGFKAFAPAPIAADLWKAFAEAAVPVGFEALEVTMLEVRQPRLHREVDEHAGVVECGLNWLVDLEKEQFTGRDAVVAEAEADQRRATIGFAAPPDATVVGGATVLAGQRSIGRVVDAVSDPGLDQQLGLASVEAEFCASGLDLEVQHEGMPSVTVRTLSSPYRVPTSWSAIRR